MGCKLINEGLIHKLEKKDNKTNMSTVVKLRSSKFNMLIAGRYWLMPEREGKKSCIQRDNDGVF